MTAKDRWYIRVLRECGMTIPALARAYGCSKQAIHESLHHVPKRPAKLLHLTPQEALESRRARGRTLYRRKCGLRT